MKVLLGAVAALALTGCFTPVLEAKVHPVHRDAGTDGGRADGGSLDGGGCVTLADCPADKSGRCDGGPAYVGPSCIDGTCLNECGASRSCAIEDERGLIADAGLCLQCGPPATLSCSPPSCQPGTKCTMTIASSSCASLPIGTSFTIVTRPDCQQVVPGLGTWLDFDVGTAVATFPTLGGTCVGADLFTALPRMQFTCPACQFTEVGCD